VRVDPVQRGVEIGRDLVEVAGREPALDPARIDENLEFFKREVVPQIKASPGFRALRNMMDRQTGEGMVGTSWDDEASMRAAAEEAKTRREEQRKAAPELGAAF